MGRLIDADKLIELMIKDRDYAGENGFMDMFYERQHLIGVINEQSTAYDVDAVVEQLEDYLFDKYCVEGDSKIYETVKGGGVK